MLDLRRVRGERRAAEDSARIPTWAQHDRGVAWRCGRSRETVRAMPEFVCPTYFHDRLDRALVALAPNLSRSRARRLIDAGCVYVDGRRCRVAGRIVHAGARVRFEDSSPAEIESSQPLPILFADDRIVVIDKPAGMPSAATRQGARGTALEELRRQLLSSDAPGDLHLVHRLDTVTSGVLVFARDAAAASRLGTQFAEGLVRKTYVAVVQGVPARETGVIEAPLAQRAGQAFVDPGGRPARTLWRRVTDDGRRATLVVEPTTGRMHQIRAHLAHIGHPIVGDRRYGGPPEERVLLHALRIELRHPEGGARVAFECAPPFASDKVLALPEER